MTIKERIDNAKREAQKTEAIADILSEVFERLERDKEYWSDSDEPFYIARRDAYDDIMKHLEKLI